ncbi:MAG: hypothetical protein JSS99_11060 [Actinobacteria bacterium]|nr:hypothetical protein [Actinomycetota bacterium]
MSLYRQPRATRPLLLAAIALVALLVGGAIGFALGRGSAPEPSAGDVVAQLRGELRPLAAGLELLPTEYPQALAGGGESAAVTGDLGRIRDALAAAQADLRTLDPAGLRDLTNRVAALEAAIRVRAAAAQVQRLAAAAQQALAAVPGGR